MEPLPRRLAVGVNYPWPRNYFGTHLVGSPDERWLEVDLPADLAFFRERGITVVRFWLLCGLDGPHGWGVRGRFGQHERHGRRPQVAQLHHQVVGAGSDRLPRQRA
ncbi:MAG TPA: hypothetical protein PLU22_17995, partial [Polyangiaceae bacterium]|nr:hypothetical protein [Polyangiaceae bacterium]